MDFYPYADNSSPNEARLEYEVSERRACRVVRQWRRITVLLQHAGWPVGKDRVQRIWRREGLKGSRHAQEIADFWNALARCFQIYDKKCKDRGCDPKSSPEPLPQPVPIMPIDPIVPDMPGIPEMPMPEFFPDPIFIF